MAVATRRAAVRAKEVARVAEEAWVMLAMPCLVVQKISWLQWVCKTCLVEPEVSVEDQTV
jgi:hypothetical protein